MEGHQCSLPRRRPDSDQPRPTASVGGEQRLAVRAGEPGVAEPQQTDEVAPWVANACARVIRITKTAFIHLVVLASLTGIVKVHRRWQS